MGVVKRSEIMIGGLKTDLKNVYNQLSQHNEKMNLLFSDESKVGSIDYKIMKKIKELGFKLDGEVLKKIDGSPLTVENALKLNGKTIDEITAGNFNPIKFDSGWVEFQKVETGGGNKGGISIFEVDFEPNYVIGMLKYKNSGIIIQVTGLSPNIVPRTDGKDYGALISIYDKKIGIAIGEDGLPLGESAFVFNENEGLDTFGEKAQNSDDNVYSAKDFLVRVLVF